MTTRFDAVVIGMGAGGEVVAGRLLEAGMRIAAVERELIGGECAYWACIPSKTLIRSAEARAEAARTAGVTGAGLVPAEAFAYRDYMVRHLDDHAQVEHYESAGATVIRGTATFAGPRRVEVDGSVIEADHVVLATGSTPILPDVRGLDDAPVWTSREATLLHEVPESAVVLGGGPVGIELSQLLARFGSRVTLVHRGERLIAREDARAGSLLTDVLRADGIDVRLGTTAEQVTRTGAGALVRLDSGDLVEAAVLVAATGRRPQVTDLGLDRIGINNADGGISIDDYCRAGPGVWAVGDITGRAMFTHVAKYQGRIVADAILGRGRKARYDGIPRVVFSSPELAAVGTTASDAAVSGARVVSTSIKLSETIARPWTYELNPQGELGVVADLDRNVLVGAWAVAPLASEWIHVAAQAIRAEIPLITLRDSVAQFPSYAEAYLAALERLEPRPVPRPRDADGEAARH